MTFRNLDENHDWVFGAGKSSYVSENQEIALNLETRILSFLGDCFFAANEGIAWFDLLDYRYRDRLELAVQEVIKNTPGVTAINSVDAVEGANRKITLNYNINTLYTTSFEASVSPVL